jgi:poly-gamma-glutamate synthesis protein (capsule biosynthesis protein)
VTKSDDYVAKGINYRMSPENAVCLKAAAIDCCVLANNHVLDWGRGGLLDTLNTLARLDIKTAGAGCNCRKAGAPAVLGVAGNRRLLVFSFANPTSGTPRGWTASNHDAGVNILTEISEEAAERVAAEIARHATPSDLTIVSIHWGPNWGYEIAEEQRRFAHGLIERAGVAILHGHSSHHPKGIEVHRNRLILYGCGDFLNDYEGIKGYEPYRDDLVLMYFPEIDPAGNLNALDRVPLQIRNPARPAGGTRRRLDAKSLGSRKQKVWRRRYAD